MAIAPLSFPQDPNEVGRSLDVPAGQNDVIITTEWAVTVLGFRVGAAILDLFPDDDLRTRNLAVNYQYLASWRAMNVRIVNNRTGDRSSFLPATAFAPVDDSGARIANVGFLTPPKPDINVGYYPGATRDGWAILRPEDGTELSQLVRFLPFWSDPDPSYLALPAPSTTVAVGVSVVVGPDVANLRARPTTSGIVITALPPGTMLSVTGDLTTADGHDWLPVINPATGDAGYVAADLLLPAR